MSEHSWFDIGTRIVIPLVTFGLGVGFSYALKRLERRQDDERDHVRQVTSLCSEWYDHLASVYGALVIHGSRSKDFQESSLNYLRSGTIIPQLRMHRRALLGKDRYTKLLEEVDRLINDLTVGADSYHDVLPHSTEDVKRRIDLMLEAMNGRVQAIYQLAGEILAENHKSTKSLA